MADIYRAVVTQNKDGKMHFDFAIATPQEAKLAHSYMIKLRKTKSNDDTFKDVLAPMFIENGQIKFSHPEYETSENQTKLNELSPRILTEFNKFRTLHPTWKSSFDDMDKYALINTIYADVNLDEPPNNSITARRYEEILESRITAAKRQGNIEEMYRLRHELEGLRGG